MLAHVCMARGCVPIVSPVCIFGGRRFRLVPPCCVGPKPELHLRKNSVCLPYHIEERCDEQLHRNIERRVGYFIAPFVLSCQCVTLRYVVVHCRNRLQAWICRDVFFASFLAKSLAYNLDTERSAIVYQIALTRERN